MHCIELFFTRTSHAEQESVTEKSNYCSLNYSLLVANDQLGAIV